MTPKAALLILGFFLAAAPPPTAPPEPNLCDLDGGKWCTDCGGPVGPPCPPAEDSSWVCCWPRTNFCVTTTVDDCDGGALGWCDNVTVDAAGLAHCWG